MNLDERLRMLTPDDIITAEKKEELLKKGAGLQRWILLRIN